MRYSTLLLLVLTLDAQAQSILNLSQTFIDDLARERVGKGETPGIVVAVYKDGKTTYYAQGYADIATKRSVDSKTLFEIGSITKTFTTTVIAQQAQEGKIKLSDPIQTKLPAEAAVPVRGEKAITFEDLASARSGLPRMANNFTPPGSNNPCVDYTEEKLYAFLNGYTLTRDIGSQYEYSNLGMGLLGVLAGRVDGKPYREVVETRILKPLKMKRTFFRTLGQVYNNSAKGYSEGKPVSECILSEASAIQGAGALLSNTEDMMLYLLANMNPPDNSLGRAMKDTHQVRMVIDGPNNMKIGLGWHIRNKIIWHDGATSGFRTFAGFEPEKKMAVVVLTNSNAGANDLGFHIMDETIPLKKIRQVVSVPPDILKTYVGVYQFTPEFAIEITEENGQLMSQATNQPKFILYPESQVKFFVKVFDAQVEFTKGESGAVDKLILYQDGAAHTGLRKP